ncbi:MAG: NADH-quinone oxidoreductase subunit NuoN [Hellea sp.]|nr:NADH-quinone oxidoreductase subunit NuoN [Hellea sp.]
MINPQLIAPEILLAVSASLLLGFGVSKTTNRAPIVRIIAIAILLIYSVLSYVLGSIDDTAFNGALVGDAFGRYVKFFIGIAAAFGLLLAGNYLEREKLDQYEFSVLTLYAVLGMSIMVSANNLLALYIGVEMQALALYVMAAFNRDSLRASEAGLKYFVLGALSSGLLLYGISLIYGFTGSLNFTEIGAAVKANGLTRGIVTGLVFLLCGLGFKISAAPFHMWTPDVYEGAPTPVTGFFAAAPKFAAMALITRLVMGPFGEITDQWQQVIIVFAVMSMFIGAIGALRQTNIKRLMAYSSIANMGYALVPLAAGTIAGVKGMLIFMTIYIITVIGVFACILQMRIRDGMVERISDLSGLAKTNRGLTIALTVFMLSLMGIPPLLGFFGKLYAFLPAVDANLIWLVVLALVASVIGAFYYLRIIKIMWFDEADLEFIEPVPALRWTSMIAAILLIAIVIIPVVAGTGQAWIGDAAESLTAFAANTP